MTQHHQSYRRLSSKLCLGLALTGTLGTLNISPELQREAVAQSWPSWGKNKAAKQEAAPAKSALGKTSATSKSGGEQIVRMNFIASNWNDVLQAIAKDTGATLVMDKVPAGRFSRTDISKHSKADALRIINQELEKQDFRVIDQGNFLICLHLPTARPEYPRAQVERAPVEHDDDEEVIPLARSTSKTATAIQRAGGAMTASTKRDGGIRTAAFQDDDRDAAATSAVKKYQPKQKTARDLSKTIFDAFRERAEIIDEGPGGLPAVRVYGASDPAVKNAPRKVLFTLGVDTEGNVLQVEGSGEQTERIVRLLQRLDAVPAQGDETTKLVSTKKGATAVAKNVQAAVTRLVAQNDAKDEPAPAKTQTNRKDADGNPLPDQIGGIRSDVNVEAMEDIGVLILKGNQADVDAVLAIIKQIEELSAASAPDVHVQALKHIDSEALADLLTTVYDKLKDAKGTTSDKSTPISVIAVVRPNAVLVLAAPRDLDSVLKLIKDLDKPLAPQTAFATFTLKHAIAGQMETLLQEFYERTGNANKGLATRVRIVADVRTNTVVVLAQPNDLKAIAELIPQLDKNESGAVSQVEIFPLKHAVADQLQQTVNLILQSVLNPAQLGQGQLGQQVLGIGGGNSSTQLRDVRSSVLEFITKDGPAGQKLRSGILADIRINSDDRSNTVIVTAPEESLPLVRELISRLDRPATNVAEVKHFQLRNADASSVSNLLGQLFGTGQTNQNQGGGQGGNNQNAQQPAGIQLAAAENSSSVVPLRFSVDSRTNSIVAIGTAEALDVVDALILRLDASDIRDRKNKVFRLKNTEALQVAQAVQQFLTAELGLFTQQTGGGGAQGQGQSISNYERIERQAVVQAEQQTNSVLISASPRYFDDIVSMVEKLDEDLPQVNIQALLVEVQLNNTDEFGVEFGIQDSLLFSRGLPGVAGVASTGGTTGPGFNFNNAAKDAAGIIPAGTNTNATGRNNVAGQALSNFAVGRANSDLGYGGLVLSAGSESINVLLRALSENRRIEVLSRPQIRTLHNREGTITVATQVPRPSTSSITATGIGQQNIEYVPAGISLIVLPKIGSDGKIQLQVRAEKTTQLADTIALGPGVNVPQIDGTTAISTITVSDNQTAVIGGLISRDDRQTTRKVPWLGDLPVIGHAFRFDSTSHQRKELIIFLTPRVIRNEMDNEELKVIEAARLHWTECNAEELHGPIFGLPPEQVAPLVDPSRFDNLQNIAPPAPMTVPPAPASDGVPMSRRSGRDSGVRQVSHEEPTKGKAKIR